ncbi:hypothetical protein PSYMO_40432 [Pseudomonas amygdali pv. mori str. 301020]|uniref:Uncharacterized protein n=1 Tax=Pseudomonas amygdali pv. mori str. 301020 TaxID=629261 RepID=A0A656GNI1_PSEA0|nr:hypothetical protein PSYMO_28611 [Pseudomonas amygdali pv. mori str. 301020]EGH27432.1 hypothetical protein PSYMO_40432 [Pseudomonas amygdali pv. mori str. 301020]
MADRGFGTEIKSTEVGFAAKRFSQKLDGIAAMWIALKSGAFFAGFWAAAGVVLF